MVKSEFVASRTTLEERRVLEKIAKRLNSQKVNLSDAIRYLINQYRNVEGENSAATHNA